MSTINDNSLGMVILRAWLWIVPIGMILAAMVFGLYAFVQGEWALFGVMVALELVAISLLIFHWWVLYRFGKQVQP
jgi:hypothetical protein